MTHLSSLFIQYSLGSLLLPNRTPLLSKAQSKGSYTCITHDFYSILTRIAHKFYARSQCSVSHKMSLVNALRTKLSFLQVYFLSNFHFFSYISVLSFICLLPANCEHFVFVCETGHIACFVNIYFINFVSFTVFFIFLRKCDFLKKTIFLSKSVFLSIQ